MAGGSVRISCHGRPSQKVDFSRSFNRNDCSRKASQITGAYAIQKQFQATGTFQNCISGKNRFSKKKFRSFQLSSHFDNLKRNWQKPFFYNSVESMADWSLSSDLYKDSNQDCLCFGKSERPLFHSANWAMGWMKIYSKIQDMYCKALAQWQVKQCVLSGRQWGLQSTWTFSCQWLSDRVLDDGNFSGNCLPEAAIQWSHVAGSRAMKEFTFGGMKVRLWRSLTLRSNQRIQD